MAERKDRAQTLRQERVVAARRIPELGLLGQGDGALGQALEDEVLEIALLGELDGRLDPVAGIACAGADPDLSHGCLQISRALEAGPSDHTIEMIGSQ